MTTDTLLEWRKEFPILDKTAYLISHSLGAMPRSTSDALQQFAETWASRGVRAWEEGWWEMPVTIGDLIGSIIGAGAGEVVMHQNVSICQSIVTSCFDWNGPRKKLVTDGLTSHRTTTSITDSSGRELAYAGLLPRTAWHCRWSRCSCQHWRSLVGQHRSIQPAPALGGVTRKPWMKGGLLENGFLGPISRSNNVAGLKPSNIQRLDSYVSNTVRHAFPSGATLKRIPGL